MNIIQLTSACEFTLCSHIERHSFRVNLGIHHGGAIGGFGWAFGGDPGAF